MIFLDGTYYIPGYVMSSFIATIIIVGLGMVSLFYAGRDRVRWSFAAFCLAWALLGVGSILLQMTPSPMEGGTERAFRIAGWLPIAVFLPGIQACITSSH